MRVAVSPVILALSLALTLGACGSSHSDPAVDARIAELEKKVDAADKRSRQAINMAAQPNSAPMPDAGGEPSFDNGEAEFDNAPESDVGVNQDGVPPPPMIAPEG
ncbi:hypothetical protein HGI47_11450 [Novosphingobium sp. ERN07]|nr:hypothetical protein [Novosphingobium sp. ERN07]